MMARYTHRIPSYLMLCFGMLILGACSVMAPRPVTPIADVITLSKDADADRAVERIASSKTTYALRGSDFGNERQPLASHRE